MDTTTPNNFTGQHKVNQKPLTVQEIFRNAKVQRARLVLALSEAKQPLNMRQLSAITGIERPTVCRRIAELQGGGLVTVSHYDTCPISRYPKVGFYSCTKKGGGDGQ